MSLLLAQTIVPAEAALNTVALGYDTASEWSEATTTLYFIVNWRIFSTSAKWRSHAPRWCAGIVLVGQYDDVIHRYVSFGSGRSYKSEKGIAGFDGYNFEWQLYELDIKPRQDGNWRAYYLQRYRVNNWTLWGAYHFPWTYGELYVSTLIAKSAWG